MRGTTGQRCACPTRKDATGKIAKDDKGNSVRDHSPRCRPSWFYCFDARPGADGKRRQVTKSGFSTKKEAQAALTTAMEAESKGLRVDTGKLTVAAYLDEWLAGKVAVRANTRRSYEGHIRNYLKPAFGGLRLSQIRHGDVSRLFADLSKAGDLSPASIKRVHATVNAAFNDAVRRQLLVVNPAAFVELPSVSRKSLNVWTPTELAAFLLTTKDDRLATMYRLFAFTGMRRGEVAGLRWCNVDLTVGQIHVREQRVQLGYAVEVGPPKSDAGMRTVDMDGELVEALRAHGIAQGAERLLAGAAWVGQDHVFTKENGEPLHPEYISRRFGRLTKKAGLPVIRLHDLRHTHASHALAVGVQMKVVQERLGHSTMALTADTYTHVMPKVRADAAELIARLTLSADPALAVREQVAS